MGRLNLGFLLVWFAFRSHPSLNLPSYLTGYFVLRCLPSSSFCLARSPPQAISCAAAYESEWPLLIICPSSARYHWEHELLKWLDEDSITKKQITVVCKGKQDLSRGVTKVVIMSYELVRLTCCVQRAQHSELCAVCSRHLNFCALIYDHYSD